MVLSLEDDRVTLRSTRASAPGSPIEGKLGDGTIVRVKVARCRADAGAFRIEGRLIDASRALRDRLKAGAESGAK